jgi:hypothetical protein
VQDLIILCCRIMMWSIRNLFLHAYVSLQSLSIEERLQFLNCTVNLSADWSQLASGWFCTQLIFIKCYCAVVQLPKSFQGQFQGFSLPKDFVPKWFMASFTTLFFSAKTAHWRSAATPCQSFFYMLQNICFQLLEVHVRCSQILLLSCKFMSDNSEVAVSHDLIEHSSELPTILCNAHQTWLDGPWKHSLLVHSLCE